MLVSRHIIFGFIFSILLFILFPSITLLFASIIFLSSVLMDIDHYLLFVFQNKDMSLKRAYNYFYCEHKKFYNSSKKENLKKVHPHFILHGVEFVLILIILTLPFPVLVFILIGVLFHLILDYIDLINHGQSLHSKTSQIHLFIKNKKRKKLN